MTISEQFHRLTTKDIQIEDKNLQGRYKVGRISLMHGNDGVIKPMFDTSENVWLVGKTLLPKKRNETAYLRLLYEYKTLDALNEFDFVPKIHNFVHDMEGVPYLIMEDLSQEGYIDIGKYRKRRGWTKNSFTLLQAGLHNAFSILKDQNIYHRDVHESHVLFKPDQVRPVVLLDFSRCSLVNAKIDAVRSNRPFVERQYPYLDNLYGADLASILYGSITGAPLFRSYGDELEGGVYGYFDEKKFFRSELTKNVNLEVRKSIVSIYSLITANERSKFPELATVSSIFQNI